MKKNSLHIYRYICRLKHLKGEKNDAYDEPRYNYRFYRRLFLPSHLSIITIDFDLYHFSTPFYRVIHPSLACEWKE